MQFIQLLAIYRMSLNPVQHITLTWRGLNASIKEKQILSESTGYCKSGEMLAIMGPSGSGKTTMLSLITHKQDSQLTVAGDVYANNANFDAESFCNFGVYVYQNDVLHPTMTVRQTLVFIAKLKFKSIKQAQERVGQLISEFQLQKCADHLVGTAESKGISGGEKKRVCIAVQMVSKPSLVILDEPTSGLDSYKAGRVIKTLKKLAKQGHTIIFTIHQPSFLLYSMLNRLIVLNSGQTIYQGQANKIQQYLQSLKINVSKTSTICDFFMLEISQFKKKKSRYYETPFNRENYQKYILGSIDSEIQKIQSSQMQGFVPMSYIHGFFKMFSTLFEREWTNYKRNPLKIARLLINYLLMSAMIGFIFFNSVSSPKDITAAGDSSLPTERYRTVSYKFIQAQSSCYINVISTLMVGIMFVALQLPTQRPIFYKEESSRQYTVFAYFAAKVAIEVICVTCGTLIYTSIIFWILGFQRDAMKFIFFSISIVQVSFVGNSIGFFTGALFRDPKKAAGITSFLILPLSMMSGLYNKLNYIPPWIGWLQYVSPFKYALQMLLENQYQDFFYQNGSVIYDYKEDLDIKLSWFENAMIILGLAGAFYTLSFVLLLRTTKQVSV